jgi:di/tricarboxylate transporter
LSILFFLAVFSVFRVINYVIVLVIVSASLLIIDRKALREVDWGLLFTFVCFFIFSGNLARIEPVREFFAFLLEKNTLLVSVLSCQIISNVPSAILLSEFTENYKELLLGVNIGGVGTLISSLASLITFREYTSHVKGKTLSYVGMFSAFNFGFLIILTVFALLII